MFQLIKFEFFKAYRQKAFLLGTLFCCGFLIIAALTQESQLGDVRGKINEQEAAMAEKRALAVEDLALVESGEKTYTSSSLWDDPRGYYTWHEFTVQLPVPENAFWAVGQRDLFEDIHTIGIFKPARVAAKAVANPLPMLWGQFDPAFVLVFILPLFLIGLGFRLIGEESSSGTLPLILSQPISTRRFFILKTAVWFLPFLLAVLASLAFSQAWASGLASLVQGSFLILAAAVSLYALFWMLVTLLLCRFCPTSSMAALGSVMLWVVMVVVLPKTLATLSSQVRPVPQRILLTGALREATRAVQAKAEKLLERYYSDHPELAVKEDATEEDAHQNFFDYYQKTLSINLAADAEIKPLLDDYYGQRDSQQQFEQNLSFFVPPAMFQHLLEIVSGSSSKDRLEFAKQVESFSTLWREHFQRLAFEKRLITSADIPQLPRFEFKSEPLSGTATKLLLVMLGINLLLLGWAWISFANVPIKKD